MRFGRGGDATSGEAGIRTVSSEKAIHCGEDPFLLQTTHDCKTQAVGQARHSIMDINVKEELADAETETAQILSVFPSIERSMMIGIWNRVKQEQVATESRRDAACQQFDPMLSKVKIQGWEGTMQLGVE